MSESSTTLTFASVVWFSLQVLRSIATDQWPTDYHQDGSLERFYAKKRFWGHLLRSWVLENSSSHFCWTCLSNCVMCWQCPNRTMWQLCCACRYVITLPGSILITISYCNVRCDRWLCDHLFCGSICFCQKTQCHLLFFGAMVICGCQQYVWFWCIPTTQKSHLLKVFQDTLRKCQGATRLSILQRIASNVHFKSTQFNDKLAIYSIVGDHLTGSQWSCCLMGHPKQR